MRTPLSRVGIAFFIVVDAFLVYAAVSVLHVRPGRDGVRDAFKPAGLMRLSSPAFQDRGDLPADLTCDGEGRAPELRWEGVPRAAASLVLVVEDPDAPSGTWTHWTAWDIDPASSGVVPGAVPPGGTEGVTSAGTKGWHPPCPPFGRHRYAFRLSALDTRLGLDGSADPVRLAAAMQGHVIDAAVLVGAYSAKP
jgi:Raf kinase inhibitor-like YbhB/YbcL family protein